MVLLMEWLDHILFRRWKTNAALPNLARNVNFNVRLVGDVTAKILYPNKAKLVGVEFAPTWLRQASPPASRDHFNHCVNVV